MGVGKELPRMFRRLAAVVFIFMATAVAWAILGTTIFHRTYSSRAGLKDRVVSTWGAPHEQVPPSASFDEIVASTSETTVEGRKVVRTTQEKHARPLPLENSRIDVGLDLEHRRKGLLWYSTYSVAFGATYMFRNTSAAEQPVTFELRFPASRAVYDGLIMEVDGVPLAVTNHKTSANGVARIGAGRAAALKVAYRSQGLDSWRYSLGGDVAQVRDFSLKMITNFKGIDFPESTLSPSAKRETGNGWELTWTYQNLVSGFQIGMEMPQKLQPGPLAGRISYFAPVALLFFFFLMFIITTLRRIDLHPMNYFFLACAFFAFHLLLAYLVDHVSIHAAFAVSSAVSVFLVVSYLRLVAGMRFAALEAGTAQLVYLVLFSYAFFFEGFTGLAVTVGSIATLFVVMQMTGRIRWTEVFARRAEG